MIFDHSYDILQLIKLEFDEQLSYAPKAPSDEGAVTEGDWGRENYPSVTLDKRDSSPDKGSLGRSRARTKNSNHTEVSQ